MNLPDPRTMSDEELERVFEELEDRERAELTRLRCQAEIRGYGPFTSPEEREAMERWNSIIQPYKKELRRRDAERREVKARQESERRDREALLRALTVRPRRPTVADVDAQASADIESDWKLLKYRNGWRLLWRPGAARVEMFDTQSWCWTLQFYGGLKTARAKFNQYVEPLEQEYLDRETDYIWGEWLPRYPDLVKREEQ